RDVAAEQTREALRDGEAKTGAAEIARRGGVGLNEWLEQLHDLLLGHADAGIGDIEYKALAVLDRRAPAAERDLAGIGEFAGVGEQIHQALIKLEAVLVNLPKFAREIDDKLVSVLVRERFDGFDHVAHGKAGVKGLGRNIHAASLD